jgi:hypothetical protein
MKPTNTPNTVSKMGLGEYDRVGELVQSTLYTFMKLSQRNPLQLLMYANEKRWRVILEG